MSRRKYYKWDVHWPGAVYAEGPLYGFSNEQEVREYLRCVEHVDRLPPGLEVWKIGECEPPDRDYWWQDWKWYKENEQYTWLKRHNAALKGRSK